MVQDYIIYNNKKYQLSTVYIENIITYETMVFPVDNEVVSGREVYCFRTCESSKSQNKHKDILYNPEKYLSEEAITEYLKSKEEDFEDEEQIKFPFQFLEQYFLGEISFDGAVDRTIDEVYRLIGEYVEKHNRKT